MDSSATCASWAEALKKFSGAFKRAWASVIVRMFPTLSRRSGPGKSLA
ncbi:Uncharacterised protein [Mycobacterium tuberculosis]|nr:Uncharacterised protein [Mycobacterium tuberculosis]